MAHIHNHKKIEIVENGSLRASFIGNVYTSLPCHTCKKQVALSAASCPQCGETDPFYFVEYSKLSKKYDKYHLILALVGFVLCIWLFNIHWVAGIFGILISIAIVSFSYSFWKKKLSGKIQEINRNYILDTVALSTWKYYIAAIEKKNYDYY
jgi:hypothetical protein